MQVMAENAETEEEFYDLAKQTLRDLGVPDPTVGETGTIPISNSGNYEIIETNIRNTTKPGQQALNQFPRKGDERIVNQRYDRPICNILGCGIIDLLGIECSKTLEEYVDPEISFRNTPTEISSATARLNPLNPRIEGSVNVRGENFTKPGKVIEKTEYKCSTKSDTNKEIIDSSSIIDMEASHNIVVDAVDDVLDTVQSTLSVVQPNASKSADVSFEKTGALSTLEGIIDVWTTGSMTAQVTGSVDVKYEWKDSVKTETFTIDSRVRMPVNNLEYGL